MKESLNVGHEEKLEPTSNNHIIFLEIISHRHTCTLSGFGDFKVSLLYLKHQFERLSHVFFLQKSLYIFLNQLSVKY